MTLLELEHVSKRYHGGVRVALDDVSLVIDAGEMVAIWGERQSGRSTLLRIAAGIERPDTGVVRFAGYDLAKRGGERLGHGISYCRRAFRPSGGPTVLDQLMTCQYARRVPPYTAIVRAWKALERVDVERCARLGVTELKTDEVVRVAVARALTSEPRLLVVDEPMIGVDLLERDGILTLLRSLADEGVAMLTSTGEGTGLLGADRVLSLGKGKLRGELTPDLAQVDDLSRRRQARG
ncbi:MAG TPA: ATP-binding cassette domain-containing protein [Solirubrobacteraceae bacterium]|jgi:putative ABC transport system ATP-binding protein|nr:ATP-binding cassette domain-containing protein [Solirubrobacteraceae bacterium]